MNKDQLTLAMWIKPSFDPTVETGTKFFFESGDSAGAIADSHVRFYYNGTTPDRLTLEVRKNNLNSTEIGYTPAVSVGMTQNTLHLIVCTFDAAVANSGHIYVDGVELSTGSTNSVFNVSETGDTIGIGSLIDGTLQCSSAIDEVIVIKKVLTAREIADIHALGIGLGIQRNRWTVRLANSTWNPQWLNSDVYDIPLLFKEVLT